MHTALDSGHLGHWDQKQKERVAGVTTQSVHCLLPKHKDLGWDPSSYIKHQAWLHASVVLASGGAVGRSLQFSGQLSQPSQIGELQVLRESASKQTVESN